MITIKKVNSKKEMKQFVLFPFELYKNNPFWIPPIVKDELNSFDPAINPVFDHAKAEFFLAYKEDKIVGRIVAIINWNEVKTQFIKKMRFGWFDVIDDIDVSKKLLEKVASIGKENNLEFIEGPVGFSNLDKVGVLTEGFDQIGTMVTWYNHKYYLDHLVNLGFVKEKGYIEQKFDYSIINQENYARLANVIQTRFKLKPLRFKKTKEILPYVNEMFEVFNSSYGDLASFVPISEKQITYFKEKYIPLINPDFISFVKNDKNKLVAFGITMPSFGEALQKANGKLFPFGFLHFLRAKAKPTKAIFYLIGIDPEYQKKGVHAIIFNEFILSYNKYEMDTCILTPELEDNHEIQKIWKHFNPVIHKKRQTMRKSL